MLSWIHKLLAGDQNAAPADAEIERDAQGRIVSVKQTLSAGDDGPPSRSPNMVLDEGLKHGLREASVWLTNANIALARNYGVGLEETFAFDQDEGKLELLFADGRKLLASAQLIGSFDPRDRSFMWAWANPSVEPRLVKAAEAARGEGERLGATALTTPTQNARFDDLVLLAAFVAMRSGAQGLYRCIVNNSTSLFMAIDIEALVRAVGSRADPGAVFVARADEAFLGQAHALVRAYDEEMLPLDRALHEAGDAGASIMDDLLAQKTQVYDRYWSRSDGYWKPGSFGWPSEHDAARISVRFTTSHTAGGALDVAIGASSEKHVYRVERIAGALKITDQLIDWGQGFVWPAG
jgi:hypothetical protein